MSNKRTNPTKILGFKRPLNHEEDSKQQILALVQKENPSIFRVKKATAFTALSGIAASLIILFFLNDVATSTTAQPQTDIDEDVFVTSLLMETLLLEEGELDMAIQEALLDDFENDLALN